MKINNKKIKIRFYNTMSDISKSTGIKIQNLEKNKIYDDIEYYHLEPILIKLGFTLEYDKKLLKYNKYHNIRLNYSDVIRDPIVSFIGHVDHGKTSLINTIMDLPPLGIKEFITQDLYFNYSDKHKIFLLDTPGHDIFNCMKEYAINISDVISIIISINYTNLGDISKKIKSLSHKNIVIVVTQMDLMKDNRQLSKIYNTFIGFKIVLVSIKKDSEYFKNIELLISNIKEEYISSNPKKIINSEYGIATVLEVKSRNSILCLLEGGYIKNNQYVILTSGLEMGQIFKIKNLIYNKKYYALSVLELSFDKEVRNININDTFITSNKNDDFNEISPILIKKSLKEASYENKLPQKNFLEKIALDKKLIPVILITNSLNAVRSIKESFRDIILVNKYFINVVEQDIKYLSLIDNVYIICFRAKYKNFNTKPTVIKKDFENIYDLSSFLKEEIIKKEQMANYAGKCTIIKIFNNNNNEKIFGCRLDDGFIKEGFFIDNIKVISIAIKKNNVSEVKKINAEFGIILESTSYIKEGDILTINKNKT